ncbi:MAG: hypothetical protein UU48_C0001G0073 [Candidatus Uhrbacteria bacterium GW2011_GWF2_41_16]|jgi:hypothetical protein|uniref:Uncharacterized protein n=2 Tax=Candidatus Uhriibacteriota TaxID=1752732 RepID=A0A0G0VCV9_9BACT|nr:MAG: hypothetical protein UU31_C0002G0115 [Candidatus Uhrbacteria bacterium GW2011_GWA2_41_10]KKR87779.1 MAG: hypothetical protein UU35_C0001G0060 [Candidatus Uhrbacteria bacterium GW2011_GWC2_41_11]KKR98718.1 MAG: hypothetical protein UU48_C0001G0073 [Candidatus Uhrbacteria bacterium GW2011_GWF2_41_16]HBP00185.1 hypothetical protein [Candidatus Uhrbacteria bacterium]
MRSSSFKVIGGQSLEDYFSALYDRKQKIDVSFVLDSGIKPVILKVPVTYMKQGEGDVDWVIGGYIPFLGFDYEARVYFSPERKPVGYVQFSSQPGLAMRFSQLKNIWWVLCGRNIILRETSGHYLTPRLEVAEAILDAVIIHYLPFEDCSVKFHGELPTGKHHRWELNSGSCEVSDALLANSAQIFA